MNTVYAINKHEAIEFEVVQGVKCYSDSVSVLINGNWVNFKCNGLDESMAFKEAWMEFKNRREVVILPAPGSNDKIHRFPIPEKFDPSNLRTEFIDSTDVEFFSQKPIDIKLRWPDLSQEDAFLAWDEVGKAWGLVKGDSRLFLSLDGEYSIAGANFDSEHFNYYGESLGDEDPECLGNLTHWLPIPKDLD